MEREEIPYHPPKKPNYPQPPTAENLRAIFSDCADLYEREIVVGGDPKKRAQLFSLIGMVRNERLSDYVLKPMSEDQRLGAMSLNEAIDWLLLGGSYNMGVFWREEMDQIVLDLAMGNALLFFPGKAAALSFVVQSEEKRGISSPENEPVLKGGKEAFVESVRTNTAMVRRRLRSPEIKIQECLVGRRSAIEVDILYVEGLTNPEMVAEARRRVEAIDIDALSSSASLEEYLADTVKTPFPLLAHTERPDRFCMGLMEGRVGILAEGLALGFLLPGTLGQFFKSGEDRTKNWMEVSLLRVLRYLCVLTTLFLPAFYLAAVNFHPEMIPAQLAWSIAQAKLDVPFSTLFEVLAMLLAFEMLQEAGLRLPTAIGTTVSILGGLVVGTAAVEAKIVSPAVLIVVAVAGIAGYTMPSQEFAGALRIWRLLLLLAASLAGLVGMFTAAIILIHHLAGLESFGVPYLTPFAAAGQDQPDGVLRRPLPWMKLRERALKTQNRRNQK